MVELDESTRRALLARDGPPPSARAEVLASLRVRVGDPGPDDPGEGPEPGEFGDGSGAASSGAASSGAQLGWAAKVVAATLASTGAGLLILKLGAIAVTAVTAPVPVAGEPVQSAPEHQPTPVPMPVPMPPPTSPEVAAAQTSGPTHEPDRPGSARVRAPVVARPNPSESTLAAELELIAAAKRLRSSDPAAALVELDTHAERFAAGALAPERDCLRVELLCVLDRPDALARARANFLREHPDSPLRARVLASCREPGTDSRPAGD